MENRITKSLLRKTILQYRKLIEQNVFKKRNAQLLIRLQEFIYEKNFQVIHTFLPIKKNREIDVTSLFSKWREQRRKIVVSKTNFNTREMSHFSLEEDTILQENSMGIPEPIDAGKASFSQVDIILVPLLAHDKSNNRIGYGGGFYDQLLLETKAIKVGLSLSSPMDEILQKDKWDIPLDYIISYKNNYNG